MCVYVYDFMGYTIGYHLRSYVLSLCEVLITSATDALAFLVGASTVLPALGWFCTYAGVSIVLCGSLGL